MRGNSDGSLRRTISLSAVIFALRQVILPIGSYICLAASDILLRKVILPVGSYICSAASYFLAFPSGESVNEVDERGRKRK